MSGDPDRAQGAPLLATVLDLYFCLRIQYGLAPPEQVLSAAAGLSSFARRFSPTGSDTRKSCDDDKPGAVHEIVFVFT